MIQVGNNITSQGDTLHKINIDYLFHSIKQPKPIIQNKIGQLRVIKSINPKQYSQLKRKLPYFVCGIFNPNIRRTENFAYTSYFIIDIDHVSEKGIDLNSLRNKIESDSRVLLSFISPSEDGLKVMFKLNDRCYDSGIYTIFYKLFLSTFSDRYKLDQIADSRTSDVTRACFISFDPYVYYNPKADTINLKTIVDSENSYKALQEIKDVEKKEKVRINITDQEKVDVDNDVIQQIKTILRNTPRSMEKQPAYVPEQLNEIITDLEAYIIQTGVVVKEIKNISYGKKIKVKIGLKEAEVNLFYGKRGFSVVQSPRTGTTPEMNQMLSDLVQSFLTIYK